MRSSTSFFILTTLFLFLIVSTSTLNDHLGAMVLSPESGSEDQTAFERREAAYRANNIGAALLEQYKAKEAAESFTRALEIKPDLLIARINLGIALYYLPDADGAKRESERALTQDPNAPQPHYILGLIARARNRFDEAINEFQKVLKIDPDDVGSNINVGQTFAQQKQYPEAIAAFRKAIDAEPYNETAVYNLGLLLTRTGHREEGQRLLQKFQQLKQSGAGTTLGTNYLEGGHYGEAVVSTGAEAELVDHATPDVKFTAVTERWFGAATGLGPKAKRGWRGEKNMPGVSDSHARAEPIVLFDYNADGHLDIFDASSPQRLLRNDGGTFTDVTAESGLEYRGDDFSYAAVAGDYDNDGNSDLFIVRGPDISFVLYHNDGNGHFSDRTKDAGILFPPKTSMPRVSCAFVDVDHDGDLDIFITGPPNILLRNNGNGTFTDITEAAKVGGQESSISSPAVVPTDFDNRRDIDLFVLNRSQNPPALFRNMRDGTFADVAKDVGLGQRGLYTCVAAGDLNKDGFTDFFLGRSFGPGIFAISSGKGHFDLVAAPAETQDAIAAQLLDYDNDGLLDLALITKNGLHVWRNVGTSFVDVSSRAIAPSLQNLYANIDPAWLGYVGFASGDLDGDGDIDLAVRGPKGELKILRNDGGNRNHSVAVNLRGRVSNKSAVEAKVEVRAGSLWQKLETYSASPAPAPADLIFGLGKRERPDAVRVIWPAGIVQAETEFPAQKGTPSFISLNITELDRKPSSCPYLYTWNGDRFEFVTDFMGGGEMGYLEEPGRYNTADPDEYVRIRGEQLKERKGRYELRVTDELEEAMFVDRLQLLVIAHPLGTEVYPNEGMNDPPKASKLFLTRNARPPLRAVDDHGSDVLDRIATLDRRYPDNFKLDRIRGYGAEHSLTLKLAEPASSRRASSRTVLLLTGWTDYAWSSDNVAASQAGKAMTPPALQVRDEKGIWRTVIEDIGIPVGRPQTVTIDLTGKFLSTDRQVRIVTDMRIYWDQILVATSDGNSPMQVRRLDPVRAELRWRGFSDEVSPDSREPFSYDYQRVSFTSPWKVMTGHYTREGDVRQLLSKSDDMFAICRPGDEVSLSFDATALPPLPAGWTRTFLLYADGFSKEMDINSASPDQLAPLPFHGMSRYPYKWPEHYPLTNERQRYIEKYNTRVVTSPVPSIDMARVQK
jgi:Tfp pilus assembly protein PilF